MQAIMGFLGQATHAHLNVLTINYNDNLPNIWKSYHQMGLVSRDAGLYNMYYSLQAKVPSQTANPRVTSNLKWHEEHDEQGRVIALRDADDQVLVQLTYRPDNELWYVTYLQDGVAHHRDVFDVAGNLSVTQYLDDQEHVQVVRENFYRADRSVALEKVYGANRDVTIKLFDRQRQVQKTFTSELELVNWWMMGRLLKRNSVLVIGLDFPLFDAFAAKISKTFQVLPIISANDLKAPAVEAILNGRTPIDAILVTDEGVRDDLKKRLRRNLAITVIPSAND